MGAVEGREDGNGAGRAPWFARAKARLASPLLPQGQGLPTSPPPLPGLFGVAGPGGCCSAGSDGAAGDAGPTTTAAGGSPRQEKSKRWTRVSSTCLSFFWPNQIQTGGSGILGARGAVGHFGLSGPPGTSDPAPPPIPAPGLLPFLSLAGLLLLLLRAVLGPQTPELPGESASRHPQGRGGGLLGSRGAARGESRRAVRPVGGAGMEDPGQFGEFAAWAEEGGVYFCVFPKLECM